MIYFNSVRTSSLKTRTRSGELSRDHQSVLGKRRGHLRAAPGGRASHPREEHLLPLHVVAGAAGEDAGRRVFQDRVIGSVQSAFMFGG